MLVVIIDQVDLNILQVVAVEQLLLAVQEQLVTQEMEVREHQMQLQEQQQHTLVVEVELLRVKVRVPCMVLEALEVVEMAEEVQAQPHNLERPILVVEEVVHKLLLLQTLQVVQVVQVS